MNDPTLRDFVHPDLGLPSAFKLRYSTAGAIDGATAEYPPDEANGRAAQALLDWVLTDDPADPWMALQPRSPVEEAIAQAPTKATGGRKPKAASINGADDDASQVELWHRWGLACKGNGIPHASMDNALKVVSHTTQPAALHYDSFLNRVICEGREVQDGDVLSRLLYIQRTVGLQDMAKRTVHEAMQLYARANRRNRLQAWLSSLTWDTEPRVEQFFIRGFGVDDNEYTRAVSSCFLIGMVARAMRPGCQVDSLPILEGRQEIGKSRGLADLGGEFYADIDSPLGSKEFCEQIQGTWLVELSELSAMRMNEVERVKTGITRVVDRYRTPYETYAEDHPRQCVFAGTTNAHQYLMDETGNRRFWPMACGTIDREWIREHRELLFAEAVRLYTAGVPWWGVPARALEEQMARLFTDSLHDQVADYLGAHPSEVSVRDMLVSWDIPPERWHMQLQRRIAAALRARGWWVIKIHGVNKWRPPEGGTVTPIRARRLKPDP